MGVDMIERGARDRTYQALIDHFAGAGSTPVPGLSLAAEIHFALTRRRPPANARREKIIRRLRQTDPGSALNERELEALTLADPDPRSRPTMEAIMSGAVSLLSAVSVLRFARDSGEVNWELVRPKDPAWAFDRIYREVRRLLRISSRADAEYARKLPSIVMRYASGEARPGRKIYDARLGSEQADKYSALILAHDPGDDAPTWRMLPEPLHYDDIAELTSLSLRNESAGLSARDISVLAGERDRSLAVAGHYEKIAPIVYVANDARRSLLLRYLNTDEEPPEIQHSWEDRLPVGRITR